MEQLQKRAWAIYLHIAICVITISLFCSSCSHSINGSKSDIANTFVEIINNEDINGLLEFASPSDRVELEVELIKKDSYMSNAFFGKNESFRSFMTSTHDLGYEIIDYFNMENDNVNAFNVLFYDKGKVKSLKGLELEELRQMGYENKLVAVFFFQYENGDDTTDNVKGQWYLNMTGHGYFWSLSKDKLKDYIPIQ